MNQTIQEAAEAYRAQSPYGSETYSNRDIAEVEKKAFLAGAQWAEFKVTLVTERLPLSNCPYGASVLATNGKYWFFATYSPGGTIEVADENEEECYLPEGWYECEEQTNHPFADEAWFKRDVIAWCPIPDSLLNFEP